MARDGARLGRRWLCGKRIAWVFGLGQWIVEIVQRKDDVKGFKLLPKRWVVVEALSLSTSGTAGAFTDSSDLDLPFRELQPPLPESKRWISSSDEFHHFCKVDARSASPAQEDALRPPPRRKPIQSKRSAREIRRIST